MGVLKPFWPRWATPSIKLTPLAGGLDTAQAAVGLSRHAVHSHQAARAIGSPRAPGRVSYTPLTAVLSPLQGYSHSQWRWKRLLSVHKNILICFLVLILHPTTQFNCLGWKELALAIYTEEWVGQVIMDFGTNNHSNGVLLKMLLSISGHENFLCEQQSICENHWSMQASLCPCLCFSSIWHVAKVMPPKLKYYDLCPGAQ